MINLMYPFGVLNFNPVSGFSVKKNFLVAIKVSFGEFGTPFFSSCVIYNFSSPI